MSVFRSGLFFAFGTLISRITGILRESVVACTFGTSTALEAFLIANRIPNMLRELFAEGALGSSFTKVFSDCWERDHKAARRLLCDALLFFSLLSFLLCLIGILGAPWFVQMMTLMSADRTNQEHVALVHQANGLTALLFPFIGIMIVSAVVGGGLHQRGRFLLSSVSPVALNLGYLLGATVIAAWMSERAPDWIEGHIAGKAITGLAVGVLLGGISQLAVQCIGLWRPFFAGRSFPGFSSPIGWSPEIRKVLKLMGPMVIASGAGQINVVVNTNFATSAGAGAVAWLNYAFRLLQLPVGMFAVAIGSAALPLFSKLSAGKGSVISRELTRQLIQSCELVLWLMFGCFCLILLSAEDMVCFLYQQGAFSHADTKATSELLRCYGAGLAGYGLIKVLSSWYYARDRTGWAMRVSLISIGTNFCLNWLLVHEYGVLGLAITASGVLSLNALGLLWGLRKEPLQIEDPGDLLRAVLHLAGAMLVSLAGGLTLKQTLSQWIAGFHLHEKLVAISHLALSGTVVLSVFGIMVCFRLGTGPREALRRFRRPGFR